MPRNRITAGVGCSLLIVGAGLLLPAVWRVREAASRMACHGNLCGLAMGLHHSAARDGDRFPAGTMPNAELPPDRRLSWYLGVLPDPERDVIRRRLDLAAGADDERNRIAIDRRFKAFICPASDERVGGHEGGRWDPVTETWVYYGRGVAWKSPSPVTHYVGVAGVGADAAELPLGHPRAGTFGYDRQASVRHGFPDGTSNTLLLIETGSEPGHWAFGGRATVRGLDPRSDSYIGDGRPFGGYHSGRGWVFGRRQHVTVAAMADGSVRSIPGTISRSVLDALATAAGNESLPTDW